MFTFYSCVNAQKSLKDEVLSPAYWNQEEYDTAIHTIHQPRDLKLNITITSDDEKSAESMLTIYTDKKRHDSKDESISIILNKNRVNNQKVEYNHSFIGIELTSPLLPPDHGINTLFVSWYKPGIWVKDMSVDIDIRNNYCQVYPVTPEGKIQSDLLFDPTWKEKKVWIRFEKLYAITSTPGEHPHGLKAQEVHILRPGKGKLIIMLDMPGFFKRWHKNFVHPWKSGDIFTVSIYLTLIPPQDFFTITPSGKTDPPFVPKKYHGKVDANDGDPYLIIPSCEPSEEIIIESIIKIPVTDGMVRDH